MGQLPHCSLKSHRVLILRSIPQLLQSRNYVITFKLQVCISRYATRHDKIQQMPVGVLFVVLLSESLSHLCDSCADSDKAFAALPFKFPGKGTLKVQRRTQRETEKDESH